MGECSLCRNSAGGAAADPRTLHIPPGRCRGDSRSTDPTRVACSGHASSTVNSTSTATLRTAGRREHGGALR